jgi:hypothetical protein
MAVNGNPAARQAVWILVGGLALCGAIPARPAAGRRGDVVTEIRLQVESGRRKGRIPPARLKSVLEGRLPLLRDLGQLRTAGGSVTVDEQGIAHVRVPDPSPAKSDVEWLSRPGLLEVVWLPEVQTASRPGGRYTFAAYGFQQSLSFRFVDARTSRFVDEARVLGAAQRIVTGDDLEGKGASLAYEERLPVANLKFGEQGTRRLAAFARKHAGGMLGVMLDGHLVGIPVAIPPRPQSAEASPKETQPASPLEAGLLQLTPAFRTPEERENFIVLVNSGALPGLKFLDQKPMVVPPSGPP